MELISIRQLSKSYGSTQVLRNLSVCYEQGHIYGLAGENGAGKTTLFNCILGLTDYEGSIRKAPKLPIGYLPADNFFYSLVTGMEYIDFCLKAKGKSICREKIEQFNELFRLPLRRYAADYSTGMKKKLALMTLLLQENDFYILDEPFNGVDLYGCIQLGQLLRSLKARGKTVLLSSHLIPALHEVCDCIDFLHRQTIVKRYRDETVEEMERDILACAEGRF